ncbi:MAG: hypothetical protein P1P88_26275, partial [Bacteroidales bacterium]|nr:hypothetical protein [Bacteroidales bacterium]
QGTQLSNLISLSGDLKTLKKLKIVGVEPFEQALMQAEKTINAHNQKTTFDIEFQGINDFIENIDLRKYIDTKGKVIVNASLALHHIQSSDLRFNALKMVKSINPAAFILVEPNVDHFEPNFYRRFQNCYQHFYAVFQVIDKLNLSKDDKNAFKLFYGREIDDIIGKHEENRFEKHEPAYRWIEKLKYSGFNLKTDFFSFPIETPHGLKIDFQSEGFLGFSYGNETVLSIIYAN